MSAGKLRPFAEKKNFDQPWKLLGVKFECKVCSRMFFVRTEAEDCFHAHFEEAPVDLRPAAEKKGFEKHWILQGVKFECVVCHKMFYGRTEADACFHGHFEKDV